MNLLLSSLPWIRLPRLTVRGSVIGHAEYKGAEGKEQGVTMNGGKPLMPAITFKTGMRM